jgi:stearoyl-CoA desaturase (delta-9 desaturase)
MATETPKIRESAMVSLKDQKELNWVHIFMLAVPPLLALYGFLTVQIRLPTAILTFIMYAWTGMGITGGYHRLWSHRAYSARYPVRLMLALGGAGAFEGSIKWWCRNHRAHHRYTDTAKDPYNALNGFFYSHLGWMIVKQNAKQVGWADISDLQRDPMVQWQHKYYAPVAIFIGIVLPTLIAGLWGDFAGGYFFAGMLRMVIVHHATFFVNSLAHTFGDKTFSDLHTSFDSFITAILTLGEGYHNYHHEFPQDYRNGIKAYHYDPTKWLIGFLSWFGLTYNLHQIADSEIKKARIQMKQRTLDNEKAKVHFGKNFENLPEVSWTQFQERVQQGEQLVVLENVVMDIKNFVHDHPGGRRTLLNWVGHDITALYNGNGSGHVHSGASRKHLPAMRVGLLKQKDKGA